MNRTTLSAATLGALLAALLPAQSSHTDPAQAPRTFPVPGTDTMVKYESESSGGQTVSFVSRDGGRTYTRQNRIDHQLHLKIGTFDPTNPPAIPDQLRAPADNRLFIVQFHTNIIREFRARLQGMGAEIHHYLPSQSYLVRMDRALSRQVAELPFVRHVGEMHVAYKLEAALLAGEAKPAGTRERYVVVLVDKRRDARGLEARVGELGGELLLRADGGILFEANMTRAQMLAIAADERCSWIEKASAPEVDIDNARIQGGMNYVETRAGIDGKGMTGHIMEGIYNTHPELAAIPGVRSAPIPLFDGAGTGHGTNTAGEIYAMGRSPAYRGLMPNAQLTYTNYNYVFGQSTRYPMTTAMINQHQVMADTASWGYGRTMLYTSRSAEMDDIIFDHDIFITQSQSNAGSTAQPRDSRPQAWAKNICSVGGFRHFNNANPADDAWSRSGSTGPAADGRIGVTLSAYYDSIGTISGTSGYTTGFGGTSGATPIINGLGMGAIEMFTDGLFGYRKASAETPAARFQVLPHFTTTKSLLIASADQIPFNRSNRYQQGWGFPKLDRLYDERDLLLVIDELDLLQATQSRTYVVFTRGGRFVASMNYAEPEASTSASVHRINSVDLTVQTADGNTYHGNNGLIAGLTSTAGGTANDLDTEETVILANAPRGIGTVTVSAPVLRVDGHPNTSAVDTSFALVVQGLLGNRDRGDMDLKVTSASPGDLRVNLSGLPGSWAQGYTLFSLNVSRPVGAGNLLGLEMDGLASSLLSQPAAPGSVFHFSNASGQYPNATYTFPTAVALAVSGLTLDALSFVMDGTGKVVAVSNVERFRAR